MNKCVYSWIVWIVWMNLFVKRLEIEVIILQLVWFQTLSVNVCICSYLCGSKAIPGAEYAAHCYCGHQFGYFSGQLGDGATMYVGEIVNNESQRWEVGAH